MSDVAAERAVVSGLFRCGFAAYADVSDILTPDAFTVPANQLWYKALTSFYEREENQNRKPDIPTLVSVASGLGYDKLLEDKKATEILRAMANFPATLENVRPNAKKVQKLHVTRLLAAECSEAASDLESVTGTETVSQILSIAETRILDFATRYGGDGDGPVRLGDIGMAYYEKLKQTAAPAGISTGWPEYDKAIGGGLIPNCVDLIVARAKAGKGLTKASMSLHISRQNIPVLDIDTEMTKEEHLRRLWATMAQIREHSIRDGEFVGRADQEAKLEAAIRELDNYNYRHNYVGDKTPEEIISIIRRWLVKDVGLDNQGYAKPCVVFYDYIKLMGAGDITGSNMSEHQSIGFITIGLKNLMGKYNARCVAFGQQNRDGLDVDDERGIALSDRLTWFSTSTSILRWQTQEELALQKGPDFFSHKLVPVLSRHGGRWDRGNFIHVKSNLPTCTLTEGPTNEQYLRQVSLSGVNGVKF